MYTPPGTPRSRSFTRFTMRVGLPHLGQSVLLVVSITFLRSAVLAILVPTAMVGYLLSVSIFAQHDPVYSLRSMNSGGISPKVKSATLRIDPLWKALKLRL